MCINCQVLYVGGLFPQFVAGTNTVEEATRLQAAVLLAFDRVNNKTDGVYDHLLPGKQVCCECFGRDVFCHHVASTMFLCVYCHAAEIARPRYKARPVYCPRKGAAAPPKRLRWHHHRGVVWSHHANSQFADGPNP